MKTLNKDVIETVVLSTGKEVDKTKNGAYLNIAAHFNKHGLVSVDVPEENVVVTLADGTVHEIDVRMFVVDTLRNNTNEVSWQQFSQGGATTNIYFPPLAVVAKTFGTMKHTVQKVITDSRSQLKADILSAFTSQAEKLLIAAKNIKETAQAAIANDGLVTDYLSRVKEHSALTIQDVQVDVSATSYMLAKEALQESIDKLVSLIERDSKMFADVEVSADNKSLVCKIENYAPASKVTLDERLQETFGKAGKWQEIPAFNLALLTVSL